MVVFAGQQLSGAVFAYVPTYFFLQAGISTENAFTIAIGSTAMAFLGIPQLLVFAVGIVCALVMVRSNRLRKRLPPGPPGVPFLGNIPQMPSSGRHRKVSLESLLVTNDGIS